MTVGIKHVLFITIDGNYKKGVFGNSKQTNFS